MKLYVVYDGDGNILRYGRSSDRTFEDEKKSGLKILELPGKIPGMDLTHKVANPQGLLPTVVKKAERI